MTNDEMRERLNLAMVQIESVYSAIPADITAIKTPEELDKALSTTPPGGAIEVHPSLVYPKLLELQQPVTIQSKVPQGRMNADFPLPRFLDGIVIFGSDISLIGLEVKRINPINDGIRILGARATVDRCRVLGNPDLTKGLKRGIAVNGAGNSVVVKNYVDYCFLPSPGQDSQAIGGYEMTAPGVLIEDNYLCGGSETIIFGGADTSQEKTPRQVIIRRNTITKRPEWFGKPVGVKNLVEMKNIIGLLFEENDCSNSWLQGQVGFLLTLSVRNQDGRAPWATIKDATFRNNKWQNGVGAVTVLARDDIKETTPGRDVPVGVVRRSVPMENVVIENDEFILDPVKYNGGTNSKSLVIGGGPISLVYRNVKISALSKPGSSIYFNSSGGGYKATNLQMLDLTLPPSNYGMFGEDAGGVQVNNFTNTNPAWQRWVESGTISGVKVV